MRSLAVLECSSEIRQPSKMLKEQASLKTRKKKGAQWMAGSSLSRTTFSLSHDFVVKIQAVVI